MSSEKTISLSGRIDSNNSEEILNDILDRIGDGNDLRLILDASDLDYISSAGLRMILKLRKRVNDISVTDVKPNVYEIFETTGFTQMLKVERAFRIISLDGCEEIGWGANSRIYRLDSENVVKVYSGNNALEEIKNEREMAKLALILGIPTAISLEVVKAGDYYGSVFELLNADSFSHILATQPDKMDWCVDESVSLLKKVHSITAPEGKLPNMKDIVLNWVDDVRGMLPEDAFDRIRGLVEAVPEDDHLIHGDYHTKNIMVQGDEVLIIDMDTLAHGHPIFELSTMFDAYIGFSEHDHDRVVEFQGYDFETSREFWRKSLAAYIETDDDKRIDEVDRKTRIVGYARMMRYNMKHGKGSREETEQVGKWRQSLLDCLDKTDTLLF